MTATDTPRHCLVCPGDRIASPPVPRGSARYQMRVAELGCSQRTCLVGCFVNAYEVGTLCVRAKPCACAHAARAVRVSVKKAGVQLCGCCCSRPRYCSHFVCSGAGVEGTAVPQMCPASSGICSPEGSPSFSHFVDEHPEVGGGLQSHLGALGAGSQAGPDGFCLP